MSEGRGASRGHDTDLRRYAADGMTLAARLTGAAGEGLTFAGDLDPALEPAEATAPPGPVAA